MVEFEEVYKSFGETSVLKGISFSVEESEVQVIIGPSGSGKSTLLRCVNRLEEIDSGIIRLDGVPVTSPEMNINRLRQKTGMVFQEFNLFPHMSVLENITLAPETVKGLDGKTAETKAKSLLEEVGLAHKSGAYPSSLSGGQKQRVAIARALAMEPDVMLFDEVTSALDTELVGEVLSVMEKLAERGMTMLVVSHEIEFARDVGDTVMILDKGKLIERGSPEQILSAPETKRAQNFLSRVLEL